MAFISTTNSDIEFVIKPVREQSIASSRTQILREIRLRAREYGDFCHVRQIDDGYTITYSHEQGYVLAESIARHFDYPENLVWCEHLGKTPEGDSKVAIVIIRNHKIMLDTEIPAAVVADDIVMSIGAGDEIFDIYTYGDVPIHNPAESDDGNDITIEPSRIGDFITLSHSIIKLIEPNSLDYLSTPAKAVSNAGFVSHAWKYALGLALLSAVGYWVFIYTPPPPQKQVITVIDNYKSYRVALQSISPSNALLLLANDYLYLLTLSRWELAAMQITDDKSTGYSLQSSVPDYQQAADFAERFDSTFAIEQRDLILSKSMPDSLTRAEPEKIVSLDELTIKLLNDLSLNPNLVVSLGKYSGNGHYRKRQLSLSAEKISHTDLVWLAGILDGRPVNLNSATFSVNQFSFSGEIILTLFGY
ncbi:MAG: hypothetical protein ACPH45_04970 [Porticoccaceae bacterium]